MTSTAAKAASPAKKRTAPASSGGGGTKAAASGGSPPRKKKAASRGKKPWHFDDSDSSLGLSDSDDDMKPAAEPTREKAAGSRRAGKCYYSCFNISL